MQEPADRSPAVNGALYLMLQNRIYDPGQHRAILDPELWQIVQDKLAANRHERSLAIGAKAPSLLAGLSAAIGCHKESQALPLLRFGIPSGWGSLANRD